MSTVAEIEAAISKLSPQDFAQLRDWILEKEDAETVAAFAEAEAELERGEGLSVEEARKQLGLQ
jgi:hypothetical protein